MYFLPPGAPCASSVALNSVRTQVAKTIQIREICAKPILMNTFY